MILILILNFFLIYLIECSTQKTNISAHNEDLQRWNKTVSLITFEQTLQEFPILIDNMQASKLSKLIQKGGCKYELQPARFAFVDNQVYLYGQMKDHPRVKIYKKYLKNIAQNYRIPDTYFIIHFYDELIPELIDKNNHEICRKLPLFVYNKNCSSDLERTKFLLPDPFIVDNWTQSIKQIKQSSRQNKWESKIQKLFFRGIPSGPHFFDIKPDENVDMFKYYHRGAFVLLSIDHPDLIDANFTDYPGPMSDQIQRRVGKDKVIFTKPISLTEHLKYKYLLSADGTGASWKRIPFILFSNSLLFKPYSQKIQWFYDKLIPGVNFVQIKEDLSDLFNKMQEMKINNEQALQIVKNANKLAQQHLNPTTIQKYTIQTLLKYSALQKLTLTQEQKQQIKKGQDIQKILINRDPILLTTIIIFIILIIVLIVIVRLIMRSNFGENKNQAISVEENSQEIIED